MRTKFKHKDIIKKAFLLKALLNNQNRKRDQSFKQL